MLRKLLFGAVALAGLMFVNPTSADAGWRRAYRHGYYAPYVGRTYYAPRRVYRPRYYANWGYSTPGYYYGGYGYPGYYGGYGNSPYYGGFGVTTPSFGVYIR